MTSITRFEKSVAEAVGKAGLTGSNITVAISGGPDSTAMLLALNRTRAKTGVSIKGAHLEHGIRGEESKSDAEHVKHLCKSINVECFFIDVHKFNFSTLVKCCIGCCAKGHRGGNDFITGPNAQC